MAARGVCVHGYGASPACPAASSAVARPDVLDRCTDGSARARHGLAWRSVGDAGFPHHHEGWAPGSHLAYGPDGFSDDSWCRCIASCPGCSGRPYEHRELHGAGNERRVERSYICVCAALMTSARTPEAVRMGPPPMPRTTTGRSPNRLVVNRKMFSEGSSVP